jgi:hypothetical protein
VATRASFIHENEVIVIGPVNLVNYLFRQERQSVPRRALVAVDVLQLCLAQLVYECAGFIVNLELRLAFRDVITAIFLEGTVEGELLSCDWLYFKDL